ncbi:MAG: bifunctional 5,10-methylenetetrahydrofolate dehydrogenase/5,10-methenyltetrahydrofolate cyclohydrolase [Candidatus Omnitrophica bacterium]|nr:bifunctional 5,10-methylenetetrahydrofolate dehydrogenase/5,10-methenyltetrahydrofolate cyclohydrolase [Candidatus Omnitrophota bacterium]
MANLLEGKKIAEDIKQGIKARVRGIKDRYARSPILASIQVGENAASAVYLKAQKKTAEELDIEYRLETLEGSITEARALEIISKLNADPNINGIIIQMPLPAHLDAKALCSRVLPGKDVEGMHPANLGRILSKDAGIIPCTAAAVIELIKSTKVDLYGKEAVIVGHSEIVGKPAALLLLNEFATTTVCHIATSDKGRLAEHVKRAEVLVAAVGKAAVIKGDWIKDGAIVIDVGINRVDGKIVGDVEFEQASRRASFITPVPGGVGPLTVTMLMRNVVNAFMQQEPIK